MNAEYNPRTLVFPRSRYTTVLTPFGTLEIEQQPISLGSSDFYPIYQQRLLLLLAAPDERASLWKQTKIIYPSTEREVQTTQSISLRNPFLLFHHHSRSHFLLRFDCSDT